MVRRHTRSRRSAAPGASDRLCRACSLQACRYEAFLADGSDCVNPEGPSSWVRGLSRLMLAVVAILLLAGCGGSPPRIVVEPESQDLGEVPQEILELTYAVRNEGGEPLQIEKVSTSCDCTKAAMDRDTIPPGGSAELRVTLDPTEDNLYGNLLRVVYLRSNDPNAPEVEVEFRVTIRKPGS